MQDVFSSIVYSLPKVGTLIALGVIFAVALVKGMIKYSETGLALKSAKTMILALCQFFALFFGAATPFYAIVKSDFISVSGFDLTSYLTYCGVNSIIGFYVNILSYTMLLLGGIGIAKLLRGFFDPDLSIRKTRGFNIALLILTFEYITFSPIMGIISTGSWSGVVTLTEYTTRAWVPFLIQALALTAYELFRVYLPEELKISIEKADSCEEKKACVCAEKTAPVAPAPLPVITSEPTVAPQPEVEAEPAPEIKTEPVVNSETAPVQNTETAAEAVFNPNFNPNLNPSALQSYAAPTPEKAAPKPTASDESKREKTSFDFNPNFTGAKHITYTSYSTNKNGER